MRLIFATDIHGSLQPLRTLIEKTHADLYLVGGDLLRGAFRFSRHFFRFEELYQRLNHLKCRARSEVGTRLFAESRISAAGAGREEQALAREYLRLHDLARETMVSHFRDLEELFAGFAGKRILVLPGNYDMDLENTALRDRNLHRRLHVIEGVRIAGYGGARGRTPGIPDDLTVSFVEYQSEGRLHSEPRDFLSEVRPDVAVVHMPPFGLHDLLRAYGNLGSVGIRDYLDLHAPRVVLCGHMHANWGVVQSGETVVVNPSNFGTIPNVQGIRRGGTFFEFILAGTTYEVGTLRQLDRGKLYDVVDYPRRRDGSVKPLLLDPERVRALGYEKVVARQELRQIRDFRRVRDFFVRHETEATRERIEDLRKVYRKLRCMGEDVAFDVLGSVNFGMSEPGSDVDLVIYRRCPCKHALPEAVCTLPMALHECFQGLREHYRIDVTDCVNLNQVEASIRAEDPECQALQRFVLYRGICRPINLRLIRATENLLLEKPDLKRKVEALLKDYLHLIVLSHSHILSFKKYESRLQEQGVRIPPGIEEKLHAYLGLKK